MNLQNLKGKLESWNDEKGFGFIKSENDSKPVFIHISALKTMNRRPVVGDIIFYQLSTDNNGKSKAISATIEGVSKIKNPRNVLSRTVFILLIILGILFFNKHSTEAINAINTYKKEVSFAEIDEQIKNYQVEEKSASFDSVNNASESYQETEKTYQCESGKVYCSQMSSYEEALFYLKNCPDVKMDGDNDGEPCEQQF